MLPLRIAVVGAGPAGIYAADSLTARDMGCRIDILDRLPTPYGLIRYGVAPDHPRIKQIVTALYRVFGNDRVSFVGNVNVGVDVSLSELRRFYDAVVLATGAERDRSMDIPGERLPRSYGAADFVAFYDSHPDRPQCWDLSDAASVAVIGVGNVALDVSRVLAKSSDELLRTEIPEHVHRVLTKSAVRDVHMFARRGPAQVKFTPVELRELENSPNVQVIVHPEGIEFDDESNASIARHKSLRMVVDVLTGWAMREPVDDDRRRIHLHFQEKPVAILGTPESGVIGLRTERQRLTGSGTGCGTGAFTDWPVQAVYRAVGYRSEPVADLPFDERQMVIPNDGGRVIEADGSPLVGFYTCGWVKRGPVGLIGQTKPDSVQTSEMLLADADLLPRALHRDPSDVLDFLAARDVPVTDFDGWKHLDAHERSLGEAAGRERIKLASRAGMTRIARRL